MIPAWLQQNLAIVQVDDELEFEASMFNGAAGQIRVRGKVIRLQPDPVTGQPIPIVEDADGREWVVSADRTIYDHQRQAGLDR
jgi:hypothetical protein